MVCFLFCRIICRKRQQKFHQAAAVKDLARFVCITCGWVYDPETGDPETGIAPGTPFEEIPEDWTCPACGVGKEFFDEDMKEPQLVQRLCELTRNMSEADLNVLISTAERLNDK